jgi:hypothetical protein
MFDTQWGMPGQPWHQQGSFMDPATPPLDDVDAGDLIQLPCVNKDWVKLICGSLDQLRNPTTWGDIADSDMAVVLDRVDKLMQMIGGAVTVGCCTIAMQLTSSCELQFSTDGGSSWTTVSGWDANLDGCIKAHVPPLVPTPIAPGLPQNNACAIAGWLQEELASVTSQKLHDALQAGATVDQWVKEAVQFLVSIAPVLEVIVGPFEAQYQTTLPQPLSDLQASVSDATFQANVRCAIFQAIKNVGYVDGTNFAAVATNIAAISYTHAWVPGMLANLWTSMGLQAIQALQSAGSLTAADCSGCGNSWCHSFDFTASDGGFNNGGGTLHGGTYVAGVGWQTSFESAINRNVLDVSVTSVGPYSIDRMSLVVASSPVYTAVSGTTRAVAASSGGTTTYLQAFSNGAVSSSTQFDGPVFAAAADSFRFGWACDTGGLQAIVTALQIRGTGLNPFGPDNCPP